mgnify:CR=1 FL=1
MAQVPDLDFVVRSIAHLNPRVLAGLLSWLNRRWDDGVQQSEDQAQLAYGVFPRGPLLDAVVNQLLMEDEDHVWWVPPAGLYGMRLLSEHWPQPDFAPGTSCSVDLLSKWLLHLTGLVSESIGGPGHQDESVSWVSWELGNWFVNSTEDRLGLFARTAWLLFAEREPNIVGSPNYIDVEAELTELLGIGPLAYLSLLVGVYSSLVAPEHPPAHIEIAWEQWQKTALTEREFEVSLNRAAIDAEGIAERFAETERLAGGTPLNILPFAEKPLLRLPDGTYICPSIRLLVQHVRDGLYHLLWNTYRDRAGRPDNRFTRFWGELVESYVRVLLKHTIPATGPMQIVWFGRDAKYDDGQQEAVDVIIEHPQELIFIEVTATALTLQSVCLGEPAATRRDLQNSIVGKAAQLSRCIDDFRRGCIDFGKPAPSVDKPIVPVVVTPGFTPSFPPSQVHIRGEMAKQKLLEQRGVLPLQVCSLGDIEMILNYAAADCSVGDLLGEKARSESTHAQGSFAEWMADTEMAAPTRRHTLLSEVFRAFFARITETLFPREIV